MNCRNCGEEIVIVTLATRCVYLHKKVAGCNSAKPLQNQKRQSK